MREGCSFCPIEYLHDSLRIHSRRIITLFIYLDSMLDKEKLIFDTVTDTNAHTVYEVCLVKCNRRLDAMHMFDA